VDGGRGAIGSWESHEQFDRFAAQRVGPAMATIGAAGGYATAWPVGHAGPRPRPVGIGKPAPSDSPALGVHPDCVGERPSLSAGIPVRVFSRRGSLDRC